MTATYDIDDAAGTVDFALVGIYSHVINCDGGWTEVSSSAFSTPSPDHIVTYAWSYTRGEMRFEEQANGTVTTTVHACASPTLVLRGSDPGWNGIEIRYGQVPQSGCDYVFKEFVATAPLRNTWRVGIPLHFGGPGMCYKMQGATLSHPDPTYVPFTGYIQGHIERLDDHALLVEGHTCTMIVGTCWDSGWGASYNNGPLCDSITCDYNPECTAQDPFNIGVPVGTWRCVIELVSLI